MAAYKAAYKVGDRVQLLKVLGGDAKVGDIGRVKVTGARMVVDLPRHTGYDTHRDYLARVTKPKVGDKLICVHTNNPNYESSGGDGWYEGLEVTVTSLSGAGNNVIIQAPEAMRGNGIYANWTMPAANAKKAAVKAKASEPKIEVKPFETKALGKHDILGQATITKQLELAAEKNIAALIVGDTGTGKTTIVKSIADKKERKYTRFNLTGETTVDEFVGKYVLRNKETIWEDGVLLAAMKAGHWLIVDEINVALPEILFVLHSLLDDDRSVLVANHNGEIIKPHPNFRFFATMNPVDEYAGTKDLNKAFKSRFGMILIMEYPNAKIEAQVVSSKGGVQPDVAMKIVDVGHSIRKAKAEGEVFYTCSTRDLIQWAMLVEDLGLQEAFEVTLLNKANGDGQAVKKAYTDIVGLYSDAEKAGHTLNLDELVAMSTQIEADKAILSEDADKIRKKVKKELLKQLIDKSEDKDIKQLAELIDG